MLEHLPLEDRAQADYFQSLSTSFNRVVHDDFLPRIYHILGDCSLSSIDIMDGRLFGRLLWEFTNPAVAIDYTDPVIQKTQEIWNALDLDVRLDLEHIRKAFPRVSAPTIPPKVEPRSSLTPFLHPTLSQYLLDPELLPEAISSESLDVNEAIGFRRALVHEEIKHWHSGKQILPHPSKVLAEQPTARQIVRRQRTDQLYRASLHRYAESMAGQGLHPITIVQGRDVTKSKPTAKVHTKEKKQKPLSKAQQIIANNVKTKLQDERRKALITLRQVDQSLTSKDGHR
jgi:hypothetical protein